MSIQDIHNAPHTPTSTTGSSAPDSPASVHDPITPDLNANATALGVSGMGDVKPGNGNGNAPAPTAGQKRKPSRRANTAERRATHNAVERQRRETLNGRFLDLAALLPNLASVRRPSKSAIVNSSIALIHSARRQRLIASRELRAVVRECEAMRGEVNEWRSRAGLVRVEEPARSPDFMTLLSVGEEHHQHSDAPALGFPGGHNNNNMASSGNGNNNNNNNNGMVNENMHGTHGWWDEHNLSEMGEEERRAYELVLKAPMSEVDEEGGMDEDEEFAPMSASAAAAYGAANAGQTGFVGAQGRMNVNVNGAAAYKGLAMGNGMVQQQRQGQQQQQQTPTPTSAVRSNSYGFDLAGPHHGVQTTPMYEPSGHPHGHSHSLPVHPSFGTGMLMGNAGEVGLDNKFGNWAGNGFYGQQQQQQQQGGQGQWGMASPHSAPAHATTFSFSTPASHHGHGHHNAQQQHGGMGLGLYTPPGSAVGSGAAGGGSPVSGVSALLGGSPSPLHNGSGGGGGALGMNVGHMYGSPELDSSDGASVASGGGSGSGGNGSGNGSVGEGSPMERPSLSLNMAGVPDMGVSLGMGAGGQWGARGGMIGVMM